MRYSNRSPWLLFAAAAVCAVTAPALLAAPAGDACALLKPAQVSAALGAPVGAGSYITPTFKRTCTWKATDGGYVTLVLQDVSGFEQGKQLGRMGLKNISVTPLSGVGDDAYYLAVGSQVGLIVKKGSTAFKIAVYAPVTLASKEAKEEALAHQVATAL